LLNQLAEFPVVGFLGNPCGEGFQEGAVLGRHHVQVRVQMAGNEGTEELVNRRENGRGAMMAQRLKPTRTTLPGFRQNPDSGKPPG